MKHKNVPRYFFYDTGLARFQVESTPDGQFPVEEAAGLLAMHCMVRGKSPRDYVVMVEAESAVVGELAEKTEKLLQTGHAARRSVRLTRRQEQVLGEVMRNLANKEIAVVLNVSVRTVKFHVSSLLSKFAVCDRMELRAAQMKDARVSVK